MSGIAVVLNLDGRPVDRNRLIAMCGPMLRRGPDRSGAWSDTEVGLVHTLLATTPEAAREPLPLTRGPLTITADARIDNREALLRSLRPRRPGTEVGDAELILRAYERWGEEAVTHLLGDFAFALWDARHHKLFSARDRFGVRPLYVRHEPGRRVALASTPYAILALPGVPRMVNEGRIADFLVNPLEGVDRTSTMFEGIHRVPPAHSFTVVNGIAQQRRYWRLEAGAELVLGSDEEYDESFLEVFSEAVRCRLRGGSATGSMLSGGMDSGAIVAVGREMRSEFSDRPLTTFSVTSSTHGCVETDAIRSALTMDGLDPRVIDPIDRGDMLPDLQRAVWLLDEPFDYHMNLQRAVYLSCRDRGVNAVLDGLDADTAFSEGAHLARLLRRGHLGEALRSARGLAAFWGDQMPYSVSSQMLAAARSGLLPPSAKSLARNFLRRDRKRMSRATGSSMIAPEFADRIHLVDRLDALASNNPTTARHTAGEEAAAALTGSLLTVGIERYERVASAYGVEPRHPFLDQRLVAWCVALPVSQKLVGGWPKGIMRRCLAGRLPDDVRWRRGKEHLGADVTAQVFESMQIESRRRLVEHGHLLRAYIRQDALQECLDNAVTSAIVTDEFVELSVLASWLQRTDTSEVREELP